VIECQVCGSKSQLFLCRSHVEELGEMLASLVAGGTVTEAVMGGRTASGGEWRVERKRRLPGLLQHLQEAAVGQARHGSGTARRVGRRDTHLHGDAVLASHIEVFPNEDETDLDRARKQRERAALAHALSQGGANSRASDLVSQCRKLLDEWAGDVAAATGLRFTPLDYSDLSATALWIFEHAGALANLPQAGRTYRQVTRLVERIERAINRPAPNRPCGPCPTLVGAHGKQCGHALSAAREDIEITCPACGETYKVEELLTRLVNQTYYLTFTVEELLYLLPLGEEDVPRRTLYHWIAKGKLKARGEDPDGKPKYLMADVRRLRAEGPKRKAVAG
jgi:hypothetical protein